MPIINATKLKLDKVGSLDTNPVFRLWNLNTNKEIPGELITDVEKARTEASKIANSSHQRVSIVRIEKSQRVVGVVTPLDY